LIQSKKNWFQKQQEAGRGFRKHDPQMIAEAVARIRAGASVRGVAREINVASSTVEGWVERAAIS